MHTTFRRVGSGVAGLALVAALAAGGLSASAASTKLTTVAIATPAKTSDYGWNSQGVAGLKAAAASFGLKVKVVQNIGYNNTPSVLRQLAQSGAGLIIAHASGYDPQAKQIAHQFKIPTITYDDPTLLEKGDLSNITTSSQQGAYLAGILAAKTTKTGHIGVILSAQDPNWYEMEGGYAAGAHSVNPKLTITTATISAAGYDDSAGGKRVATSVIARTPARTLVRSWARRSRLGIAAIQRSMIRGTQSIARSQRGRLGLIGTRRFAGAREPQAVADSALGVDHVRPVAGQLAAQVSDIGRHHGAGAAEVVVPHVVQELRPGQHPPRIEHQVAQQPELRRRQIDQVTPAADLVAVLIKLDVREREHLPVRRTGTGAAQHGTDPGRQLLQPERLGHVVIAAEGQARHLVGLGIPGGQENHRNPAAVRAQAADDVKAVGVRQHHVQDDQVEWAIPGQPQRAGAGLRGGHLKAQEPQRGSNRVAEERLIIDHQQATAVTGQARHRVTHRLAS